jgi:hypothetical protein
MPSIESYDIKSHHPSLEEAEAELRLILFSNQTGGILKIIHGYGSTGKGGKIKKMVHDLLNIEMIRKKIIGFIPGEASVSLMGYDGLIRQYMSILKNDDDFKKGNDGITYVILRH